ncbi:hypothetical protein GCM10010280_59760 [Streptomyces pilosus]|uniref:Cas12f1-like TNB domain-containing protein n=1 Tax=Streptomyces pilosus TaxID=28893 RepID=A0A918C4T8_9ACTN|nr:hypothetical protein GCM10010280_59760 [Streptomyces pilosus]
MAVITGDRVVAGGGNGPGWTGRLSERLRCCVCGGSTARKAADAAIGANKAALIEQARKHGRAVHLVDPAHTTMDCAHCGVRAKHRLPLSERTYTCTACGAVSPRDKNSARVMLVWAGLNPASAEGVRPPGALLPEAA